MTGRKRTISQLLGCAFVLSSTLLFAQDAQNTSSQNLSLDQQIQLLRKDLRSQRKSLIAANMTLTGDEAAKFWPVYDQYVSDLVKSNDAKYQLIKEYVQADSLSEQQADGLAKRWLTVDENVIQLRLQYLPKFRSVLSAKQTARFFQLDRRVQMMIDLQLSSSLPLVEQ
jgi:Spy/CpxP family protein refolding chaperone